MKQFKTIIPAILALFLSSCGSNQKSEMASQGGGGMEFNINNALPGGFDPLQNTTAIPRKLIKTGEISFTSKSMTETKLFLQKSILQCHGYISSENAESHHTNPTETLTVRVPAARFDTLLSWIEQRIGKFDSKKIDIDDVTEEFVDIEARLNTKKQLEARYLELLKKANSMDDILKIEKELTTIREDIESTEGRLRYLNNQVGYSTLKITYYEGKTEQGFGFGKRLKDGLASGGTGFLWFLVILVQLWPLWLMGFLLWFSISRLIGYRRKKRQGNPANL